MNTNSLTVALYARVSTEEQTENFSLGAQIELLRKHAKENQYIVYDEYVDGGYSGTSFDRPAFQKMLADARNKKFDLVLIYRIDRFFRNNRALLTVTEELERMNVGIKSLTEPFDTSNHLGKFIFSLFGSLAQLERDTFMERSKMGRLRRAREGYYSGTRPTKFGYLCSEDRRKLELHPEESEVAKLAFKWYCEPDSSLVQVAKKLNENGYKTKEGGEWRSDAVHDIIRDPVYTGKWYANRYTGGGKLKPKKEWIEVNVPPIVSEAIFQKAKELLVARRNYTVRNVKYKYLLQGRIKCGDCSNSVSGTADRQIQKRNGKTYGPYFKLYYRCTYFVKNVYKKLTKCNLRYIQAELLESLVWNEIETILENPRLIEKAMLDKEAHDPESRKNIQDELNRLESRLGTMDREEQRMLEAYRQNIISLDQLKSQMAQIKDELEKLSNRRNELTSYLVDRKSINVQDAVDYLEQVKKGIEKFTYESKKKVVHLLNTHVIANINGVIDIFCTFPSKEPRFSTDSSHVFSLQPSEGPIYWR